eukprot:COSAG02_NODE_758_length_17516_cov_53.301085_7_plen_60_part_00
MVRRPGTAARQRILARGEGTADDSTSEAHGRGNRLLCSKIDLLARSADNLQRLQLEAMH